MTTHRFFATSDEVYEGMRAAVDAAWGYPTPVGTQTCVPQASEQSHYAAGLDSRTAVYRGLARQWPPALSPSVGWYYVLPDAVPVGAPAGLMAGHAIQWDGQSWIDCGPWRVVIAITLEWLSWEPVSSMIAGAIAAGIVVEIDEADYWAAMPQMER